MCGRAARRHPQKGSSHPAPPANHQSNVSGVFCYHRIITLKFECTRCLHHLLSHQNADILVHISSPQHNKDISVPGLSAHRHHTIMWKFRCLYHHHVISWTFQYRSCLHHLHVLLWTFQYRSCLHHHHVIVQIYKHKSQIILCLGGFHQSSTI